MYYLGKCRKLRGNVKYFKFFSQGEGNIDILSRVNKIIILIYDKGCNFLCNIDNKVFNLYLKYI